MTDEFQCVVRIRVERIGGDPDHAFGKGTAQLLLGVENFNSLNKAAKSMGMSYSKAWKSINATEEHLGIKLINREVPRGSTLTEEGRVFLARYIEAERAAQIAVDSVMTEEKENGGK